MFLIPTIVCPFQVGLGFLVGSFLSRSSQAVTAGFGEPSLLRELVLLHRVAIGTDIEPTAIFLVGFVLYFMVHSLPSFISDLKFVLTGMYVNEMQISFANFPYGGNSVTPFSYETNITTKNLTRKTTSDVVLAPILALAPPTLLIKSIGDMGEATAADTANGIRFNDAYSYCTLANSCDPDYSIGKCWGW